MEIVKREDCIEREETDECPVESIDQIDLLEYLKMDEARLEFVEKEGWNIRHVSKTNGEFLINLIENKTLEVNEKLMTAYKVGCFDAEYIERYLRKC